VHQVGSYYTDSFWEFNKSFVLICNEVWLQKKIILRLTLHSLTKLSDLGIIM
jgi:hypothetical protein